MVIAVGVPVAAVTFTVLETCADEPLQPIAVTWMFTDPEKPLVQVITPVPALMAPAEGLLIDQAYPLLLVAVVA